MCHVEANQEHRGKLCSFGGAARGNSLARPWSLNLILFCVTEPANSQLNQKVQQVAGQHAAGHGKSVVVVMHGVPSRAEGDIVELWMGLKEGLWC